MRKSKKASTKGLIKEPTNPIRSQEQCALLRPRAAAKPEPATQANEPSGEASFLTQRAQQKSPASWEFRD
jgi:hypothetical protein